ncbi:Homeobox protein HAT3-1 [Nymphaea thermarum]|nr:Homeobox protein HAT3-1 [Nymphaea thermarum]
MEIAPDQECCIADNSLKCRQISEEKAQSGEQFNETTLRSSTVVQTFVDARQTLDWVKDVNPPESGLASDNLHMHGTSNSSKSKTGRNKLPQQVGGKSYSLRSADAGSSRSKLNDTSKAPEDMNADSSQPVVTKRRGRKKKQENSRSIDEISRIRNRVKCIISRMHYEQSLIEAYSGEGWNRQSQDKIKPEKEIKRATSEILKCKIKIRDSFKDLEFLCAEGKHQDSLFDSEGQIYSEDIFCAKCLSKDLSPDNDIILCDGVCDRGFHQMCLEPPLLKEQIPPGDEAWLCPGCKCKLDLITSLNQYQGANLSIEDSWERIFPEAAIQVDGTQQTDDLGLPSDDSEDTDFDPENPDPEKSEKEDSSSDESDFTSDSSGSSSGRVSFVEAESLESSDSSMAASQSSEDSKGSRESEMVASNAEISTAISGRRHLEHLDYKKLYDEEYGGLPSSSSDDEDYVDTETLEDVKVSPSEKSISFHDNQNIQDFENAKQPKISERKPRKKCMLSYDYSLTGSPAIATKNGQKKRTRQQLEVEGDKVQDVAWTPRRRKFTPDACKRLYESFSESQYPTRQTKEKLANELGIEFKQVSKWFENARRCVRGAVSSRSNENANASGHVDDNGQSLTGKDGNQEQKISIGMSVKDAANNSVTDDQMAAGQLIIDQNAVGYENHDMGNESMLPVAMSTKDVGSPLGEYPPCSTPEGAKNEKNDNFGADAE